jgi:hypothetical protein
VYWCLKIKSGIQVGILQGDSEISLEKKQVIGDHEKSVIDKKKSYRSFFVFKIQMIENLVKIASTLLI